MGTAPRQGIAVAVLQTAGGPFALRGARDYFCNHDADLHCLMDRAGQSGTRHVLDWLVRAIAITCLLAQLFGTALSAATPCASMAMDDPAEGMSMHDDHAPADMQAMNSDDCCDDGGVCSMAECATPVGACSSESLIAQATLLPHVFTLTVQHISAESRRLFRPPIAA